MKKRVLSLLLVVALMASLVVFPAYAAEGDKCPCGCGTDAKDVVWNTWTGSPNKGDGHYRLYEDVVSDELVIGTSANNRSFILDLNGHTWSATPGQRLLKMGTASTATSVVTILDTSAAKTGEMQATGLSGNQGGVVYVAGDCTLNILGGTLRQIYSADVNVTYGGVVCGANTAEINMYGGTITDGFVATKVNSSGGNVRITTGVTFNMYGGTITNGHAWNGGGVYVAGSGVFNMTGGTICNNAAYNTDPASPNTTYGNGVGGNIFSEGTLKISGDAVVKQGVAALYGNNIYIKSATNEFDGVTGVDGDIYSTANVTLKGTVNIPMGNSNGLMVANGKLIDVTNMNADSTVFFGVNWTVPSTANNLTPLVFTTGGAAAKIDCFKNVGRTGTPGATDAGELQIITYSSGATWVTSYCPHCGEDAEPVEWAHVSALTGSAKASRLAGHDHFFANGGNYNLDITVANDTTKNKNKTFVIDLYNKSNNLRSYVESTKVSTSKPIAMGANTKVAILDTLGGGKLNGSWTGASDVINGYAGVVNGNGTGTQIDIYGGILTGKSQRGGAIYMAAGTVNVHGGIFVNCVAQGNGGAVYVNNAAGTVNVTGGLFMNNSAEARGGTICTVGKLNMTGGIIENGSSKSCGGNIAIFTADTAGENFRVHTIKNALIRGGNDTATSSSAGLGGNIAVEKAGQKLTVENASLIGGTAGYAGGNISVAAASELYVSDSVIYNGTAKKSNGGNLYVGAAVADKPVEVTNTIFLNGKAYADVAERHESPDNIYSAADIILDNVQVYGNSGENELGSGAYVTKNVTLKNYTVIGSADEAISGGLYLKNKAATLDVDSSFSGTVVLPAYWLFGTTMRDNGDGTQTEIAASAATGYYPYGKTLEVAEANGEFTGKLYLGDHKTSAKVIWAYGMPEIKYTEAGLMVPFGATLENAAGVTFYNDYTEAVTDYQDNDILNLYTANPTVNLTAERTYYINVAGNNVTANGAATIYGIDSTTANHKNAATGSLVAEDATVMAVANDVDGDVYVRTVDAETEKFEFHHIAMDIKSIVLRTSNAGVYYKGAWNCDDELADHLKAQADGVQFGIVAGVVEAPANGFNESENFRWSYNSGAGFESGVVASGALIKGILKNDNTAEINAENFNTAINAAAYLMVTEDSGAKTYVVGQTGASKSYMDMFVQIDKIVGEDVEANAANIEKMNNFYNDWADAIEIAKAVEGAHEFVNIFQTPAEA